MIQKLEKNIILFSEGILLSYSQVFFSKQKSFALILLLVTFFDWIAGLSGLIAVFVANLAAIVIGFRKHTVAQGFYGFNSLLVGLGMGVFYQPGIEFFFVLVFSAILTFILTIWLDGFFGKYGLPSLSWAFLLGIWIVSLASREFSSLAMSERGLFLLNEIYDHGGIKMVKLYYWVNNLPMHPSISSYFKSLAAIFFQYHLLAGAIVAIGLLMYSRIAFLLSVIGFFAAYFYYVLIGANLAELNYSYIGFNYILSAIAIGGFFIVPSKFSFLWVILLTPIISFIIISTSLLFNLLGLPIYSLAFNIIVVLFLYMLKFRERHFGSPELVVVQQFSPERNLYSQNNYKSRFDVNTSTQITLPFMGEWVVSQGHNGEHTHKEDWRHAWDFEINDEEGKHFDRLGLEPKDYYCFGKPVLAPADGVIQEIQQGIPDNAIGEMNLGNNWGNTIVIKHTDKIYTKLSHLKMGSIKTYKGAYVKKGEILAHCGNSGRSVVPHLHFQVQSDPFIGSKTTDYPFAYYLIKTKENYELKTYDRPLKEQQVTGVVKNESLSKAFGFIPGQTLSFEVKRNGNPMQKENWDVKSDMYNYTYLECRATQSKAYFYSDGDLFYFNHFEGDKDSLLYFFYLAAYKIVLGYYDKLQVKDVYPLSAFKKGFALFWHDFIAPFYSFMKAEYALYYLKNDDNLVDSSIMMKAETRQFVLNKPSLAIDFELCVSGGRISLFKVTSNKVAIVAKEVES